MSIKKTIYFIIVALINIAAFIMIGVSFLGASNANGEGAPIQTELKYFTNLLIYVLFVSVICAFIAFLTTKFFKTAFPENNFFINNIFWLELGILVIVYLAVYFALYFKY